ncbi:hypothetical protein FY528_20950 [Hymenobacter lutimineralis]|uniref:Uncharacterized protein n=1 Tax=Hymenobacter lutimineralis TaxID=2606448 RepID=A0A5D6UTH1_9BACT|nr:hypothetical protein [Hymenobacter lutimineralis]TYZ05754.1 hypothetical protein FY528_20950 [Hymenobacter lutimineralis]
MKLLRMLLVVGALGNASCASSRLTPLAPETATRVYFSQLPARPYREVGHVEATGSIFTSRPQLLRQLQQRQAQMQGDALVQVRYDFVLWWPHASALIIKYQ